MALVSLPPELRSLCRRLASTNIEQLPPLLPLLLRDVGRCQEPLSRPAESSASESSPEASVLVHRLKTQITTLLNGRTSHGRFVGAALVKAVIENGGWECLRTSKPWVHGLISTIQKKDPAVTKDLCIVAVTKIYTLMHEHPTLVREIVTPTLPDFARACLQVLKPPVSSKVGKAPYRLVETIFEAISTLVPLHPTTLREFASKFRAETRPFSVPTSSDNVLVPHTLRVSSRCLSVRLHMTAAKGGDSAEWTKHVEELVRMLHVTADQVFRAVRETWESAIGYKPQQVNVDAEPRGDGGDPDQYSSWVGVQAGGERIIGLLDFIEAYLHCRTRVAVTIPITALMDIISRISSIRPPSGGEKHDLGMNPAIGREERDELWAVFPDIQIAALRLHLALLQRLETNYIPLAQESLGQTLQILQFTYRLPQARTATFMLVKEILRLCGLTLPKFTVESLSLLIKCCCRDLLGAAGYLPKPRAPGAFTSQNGQKSKAISQNADVFLPSKQQRDTMSVSLGVEHLGAAEALLTALFGNLQQQHIPSSLRSQMLRTAILCRNRDAQVASILHPARDRSGRTPQVILPYLAQQFPRDESVEILRFNFRPTAIGPSGKFMETDDDDDDDNGMVVDEEEGETRTESKTNGLSFGQGFDAQFPSAPHAPAPAAHFKASSPIPVRTTEHLQAPFLTHPSETRAWPEPGTVTADLPSTLTSPLKRKNEDATAEISLPKRVEINATGMSSMSGTGPVASSDTTTTATTSGHVTAVASTSGPAVGGAQGGEDESSDDESVHLNMELDSDDDDDDADEGEGKGDE